VASDGSARVELGASANLARPGAMPTGRRVQLTELPAFIPDRSARQRQPGPALYFPIKALRSAATPPTATATASANNVLHAAAGFSIDGSLDLHTQFDYSLPQFNVNFGAARC